MMTCEKFGTRLDGVVGDREMVGAGDGVSG
jgi:hypothetical protein